MSRPIGAHVSIAGSITEAPKREQDIGGNCGQIFTHSPRMWDSPRFTDADAAAYRKNVESLLKYPMISHATYLVNLGSSDAKLWHASVAMMRKELEAAERLGLPWVCVHPGSHGGAGEEAALKNIVRALDALADASKHAGLLLENTAGMGSWTCYKFEHLAYILNNTKFKRTGILLDTCHTFAAGYNIAEKKGLDETLGTFDELIGLNRLHAIHLNDSKGPLGGKLDRHEHIGLGKIGHDGMRGVLTHQKLRKLPFILETPEDDKRDHAANIAYARKLAGE
ncbi:MAG: deoxyribonuclease IV [Candidatus Aenigmatarchaeota archaeon]|nr:MAG: deoxyribonuclease IV [Candidatus Aenigmarchaeota archaeon]